MFFSSLVSVFCLFIAATTSLTTRGESGRYGSLFDRRKIDGYEEAAPHALSKREMINQQCATKINPDLQRCYDMSIKAAAGAKMPNNDLFNKIFGELDQNYKESVSELYTLIAEKCNPSKPLKNKIHCDEPASMTLCSADVEPVAYMKKGQVILCPKAWNEKYERSICGEDNDRAAIFVHEFMHMYNFDGVEILDRAYADQKKFYELSSKSALANADSYTLFARMTYDNCKYEDRLALFGLGGNSELAQTGPKNAKSEMLKLDTELEPKNTQGADTEKEPVVNPLEDVISTSGRKPARLPNRQMLSPLRNNLPAQPVRSQTNSIPSRLNAA